MDTLSAVGSDIGSGLSSAASGVGSALSGAASGIEGGLSSLFGGGGAPSVGGSTDAAITSAPLPAAQAVPDLTSAAPAASASGGSIAASIPNPSGTIDLASGNGSQQSDMFGAGMNTSAAPGAISANMPPTVTAADTIQPTTNTTEVNPSADFTPTSGGSGGVLNQLFGGSNRSVAQNLVGGSAILMDLLKSGQLPPGANALRTLAGTDAGLASSYGAQAQAEGEGLLPAGAQARIQNNLNSQISAIRANYAKMGMSGSSAEIQDINAAKSAALAQTFDIGRQLAAQGLQEVTNASGQEATLLNEIMQAETAQNTELGNAMASFAGAAAR